MQPRDFAGLRVLEQLYCERDELYRVSSDPEDPTLVKTPATATLDSGATHALTGRYEHEHGLLEHLAACPHVVSPRRLGTVGARPYLILGDAPGIPLGHHLGNGGGDLRARLRLGIAITDALAAVHQHGVTHRSLRPESVLVDPQTGHVALLNFDNATLSPITRITNLPHLDRLSLAYISPEQTGRMNHSLDYRTDLYSLGILLFQIFSAELPLAGSDPLEWIHAHLAVQPRRLDDVVPEAPRALAGIVARLLAKLPHDRYQSAVGLKWDLEQCLTMLSDGGDTPAFSLGTRDVSLGLRFPGRLFGREEETARLQEVCERCCDSHGSSLVLISGYSGIGKTSLAQEIHRHIVARGGLLLQGKCDQYRRDIPYDTLVQAVRGLVRTVLGQNEETCDREREQILAAVGNNGRVLVDAIPELAHLLGSCPPVAELGAGEAKNRVELVFRQFIRAVTPDGRPAVYLLDDVQWADTGTLELVKGILLDAEVRNVLFILCYRDNEVDAAHPLELAVEDLGKNGVQPVEIALEALGFDPIRGLIAETLQRDADDLAITRLSRLIYEKTEGNPFFLIQFLEQLHRDGLLVQDHTTGRFGFDIERISERSYTSNVVDHMVKRLGELGSDTREMLEFAACIGATVGVDDLCLASGTRRQSVDRALLPAVQVGLIASAESPDDTGRIYRFQHDRIQQAAYGLMDPQERVAAHARIGRAWVEAGFGDGGERIYELTDQLNRASELLSAAERVALAKLDLKAARRAKASGVHSIAQQLSRRGTELLGAEGPTNHHATALELVVIFVECSFIGGETEAALAACRAAKQWVRPIDSAPLWRVETDILITMTRMKEALAVNLRGLESFGIDLPASPTPADIERQHAQLGELLAGRSVAGMVEKLEAMDDPIIVGQMIILEGLFNPSYYLDMNLLVLHIMVMVRLTLSHGLHRASPHALGWYGVILGGLYRRYEDGCEVATVGLQVVDAQGYEAARGKAHFLLELTGFFARDLDHVLEHVHRGFEVARESGDVTIACYCSNHIVTDHLLAGEHLDSLHDRALRQEIFSRNARFDDAADIIVSIIRLIQLLRGKTVAVDSFDDESFRLADFEAALTEDRMSTMICWHHLMMSVGRFILGDLDRALNDADRGRELLAASFQHPQLLDHHYYRSLILSRLHAGRSDLPADVLAELEAHRDQIREWAQSSPATFDDKYLLVSAEIAGFQADEGAREFYEQAIAAAEKNGFLQNTAIAGEMFARWLDRQGLAVEARRAWTRAHECFRSWGAAAKVSQLEAEHPFLRGTRPPAATSAAGLDALAMVKATQAISQQLGQAGLVRELLRIAKESAGCDHGRLVLFDDPEWVVFDHEAKRQRDDIVPTRVMHLIRHTGKRLVVDDVSQDATLSEDPILAHTRALVALPISRRGEVVGALLLENRNVETCFDDNRLGVLEAIAAQAAISLENTRLYEELEERVAQRTRELRETQEQLVHTAHRAGMAEIASSILHNVGNVLNSVNVSATEIDKNLHGARIDALERLAGEFDRQRDNLDACLSGDRGADLLDLLSALTRDFRARRDATMAETATLRKCVDHLISIVHMQQKYAEQSSFEGIHTLGDIIDEAVEISSAGLTRHQVSIVRRDDRTVSLHLAKHQAVQILVNLISNAKYAMVESSRRILTLTAGEDGKQAEISVSDTGRGIAPEHLDKIFRLGFTTRADGHGLGLHTAAVGARTLGGDLSAFSEGPGRGATFVLTIPLSPAGGAQ